MTPTETNDGGSPSEASSPSEAGSPGKGSQAGSPSEASQAGSPSEASPSPDPLRVILAKLGLDGHDRGLKVVARILRDAGMEVIYLGLRQSAESIVAAAEQEDADVIGLSMHNGGHLTLAPHMVAALRATDLDIPLIVGGIVPDDDVQQLLDAGVAAVLGPGASSEEVAQTVSRAAATASAD